MQIETSKPDDQATPASVVSKGQAVGLLILDPSVLTFGQDV